jgi:2-amino-4-hydroxy-6-hydroxymethyldihydropteridine diphosphokinase
MASKCTVWLGLGANLGQPDAAIYEAAERIAALTGVHGCRLSSLYRTPPWGVVDQPDFCNACLGFCTDLTPLALLLELQGIESAMGRERKRRWGERQIDLDILMMQDVRLSTPSLLLPHPWLEQRAFVLVPLAELAPELRLVSGKTVRQRLAAIDQQEREAVRAW